MTKEALMRKAIELSKENVENGGEMCIRDSRYPSPDYTVAVPNQSDCCIR